MRIIYFVLTVAAALLVSFFFLNTYIFQEKQSKVSVEEESIEQMLTLGSKAWVWHETHYNDERIIMPHERGAFTISFAEDNTFSFTTDCNDGFGAYAVENDQLFFEGIGMTKKFCADSQEQEFVQMLEHVSGYHFGPDGELILDLKFDSGSIVLR